MMRALCDSRCVRVIALRTTSFLTYIYCRATIRSWCVPCRPRIDVVLEEGYSPDKVWASFQKQTLQIPTLNFFDVFKESFQLLLKTIKIETPDLETSLSHLHLEYTPGARWYELCARQSWNEDKKQAIKTYLHKRTFLKGMRWTGNRGKYTSENPFTPRPFDDEHFKIKKNLRRLRFQDLNY